MFDKFKNSKEMSNEDIARLDEINDKEKKEMFQIPLAFGTAGMRGVLDIGTNRMNNFTVKRATEGLANYIETVGEEAKNRGVVLSYDTRKFSQEFAILCAKVLSAHNIKVWLFESVRPVPLCSYAIRKLGAFAAIMITASHNPKQYNGYKVYGEDGAQMSPEATAKVVEFIDSLDYFGINEDPTEITKDLITGKSNFEINKNITVIGSDIDNSYYEEILKLSLSHEAVKKIGKDMKIVYTPIHGSGYVPVTTILDKMGIKTTVVEKQALPDTEFSTVKVPNPEEPDALEMGLELANKIGSDIVIGTDPDCDRMGVAIRNNEGEFVLLNGNQIGALLCDYILSKHEKNGTLPSNSAIVKTIVTTELAKKIADSHNTTTFNVLTGFKFIGEKIAEWEQTHEYTYMFGYEESFGYLAGTHARDKDAVVSSMLFAEMTCYYQSIGSSVYARLQELFKQFGYFVEKPVSIYYEGLDGMKKMSDIMTYIKNEKFEKIAGEKLFAISNFDRRQKTYLSGNVENIDLPQTNAIKFHFENGDWLCVRPSGTEPKIKIYVSCCRETKTDAFEKAEEYLREMKKYCK